MAMKSPPDGRDAPREPAEPFLREQDGFVSPRSSRIRTPLRRNDGAPAS